MPSAKRPTKTPAEPRSSTGGRPAAYDWSAIRREYIRGDDTVTLASLAAKAGAPSARQLEHRSAVDVFSPLLSFRHIGAGHGEQGCR
ncbi:hypothetical protein [Deinococcus sp. QL22]|uniref:hypothetical protein n=1 Tax=Deinococcus sp. QL22 TaxID=2939437 RepID=UPI002018332B|nr:hypothetical protein [Deinococcus sp. QL22]UQN05474.1 hypothetical protein M1R55_11370 [Deinococcus sp. QL22]